MADVHCVNAAAERTPGVIDTKGLSVRLKLLRGDLSPDRRVFPCRLDVTSEQGVSDDEFVKLTLAVQGVFVSDEAIDEAAYREFARYTLERRLLAD